MRQCHNNMLALFWKNFKISCLLLIESRKIKKIGFFTVLWIYTRCKHHFKFCSEQHKHISTMFLVCDLESPSVEGNHVMATMQNFLEMLSQKTYSSLDKTRRAHERVQTNIECAVNHHRDRIWKVQQLITIYCTLALSQWATNADYLQLVASAQGKDAWCISIRCKSYSAQTKTKCKWSTTIQSKN